MGIFNWIGKLFVGEAKSAATTIVEDEIHKVHDEIALSIAPLLKEVPEDKQAEVLENITDIAKQAAVAYVEAYIGAHAPAVTLPYNVTSTPPAPTPTTPIPPVA